jgi:hypothetical protein
MTTQAQSVAVNGSQINTSGVMQVAGGGTGLSAVGTSGYVLASNGSGNVYINGTGLSGYSGYSGTNGSNGASGISGYSGATGSNGSAGTSGYSGYSGSAASVNTAQLAKAWANWATAGTINASYNVSSVTKTGTGSYTVNMTNAMPSTNYVALAGNYPVWWTQVGSIVNTSSFTVTCFQDGSFGNADPTKAWAVVFSS